MYKDLQLNREKRERLEDAHKALDLARTSTEALTKWTVAQEERNRTMEQMARALERFGQK
jgi:bacterioferritin (cytochrome b1)